MRLDCEISVEAQPATGPVIFYNVYVSFILIYHKNPLPYQLTLVSYLFPSSVDINVLLIVWIRKGKFGELSFTMWWVGPTGNKQKSCVIHTENTFFTSCLIFGIISAIKYLQSCNPFWCHRQQRRSGRHHKDGQVSILCPSHKEWHRFPQVDIYVLGLIFFLLGWITFTGAALKNSHWSFISQLQWFAFCAMTGFSEKRLPSWFLNTVMSFTVNIKPAMPLWWPKWRVS